MTFEEVSHLQHPASGVHLKRVHAKSPKLPAFLWGDEVRLKQVLVNLTKNALKFSPMQQIKIMASYSEQNQMLEVHVSDQGKGVRADDIGKIFNLFDQGSESEREMDIEGFGMGLYISRNIVEKNGGQIDVYSAGENQGSTFMFSMKMFACEEDNNKDSVSCPRVLMYNDIESRIG